MKISTGRVVFMLAAVLAGVTAGYLWNRSKMAATATPPTSSVAVQPVAPTSAPVVVGSSASNPVAAKPATSTTSVPIQDGKTIDFSSGNPVVKDTAAEKALIAKAEKEMDDATKGVSFGPSPAKSAPTTTPPPK